ncbi:hypothetical protein LLEC1_04136 [Akanthomyces lecanii]|uniref:Uncharacterized protein n=1 Tax=Cordyceps confragosa TaxID=2714763 RepID=A0A179I4Q3_CORDF|nr:hypothetical protein LLEC1_04136 [Akanthomyces lecanii]
MKYVAAEFVTDNARDENGDAVFTAAELRWFSTNAYNLGAVHCTTWAPGRLAALFKSCLVFTQALASSKDDDLTGAAADSTFTILRCHFVLASLYISQARIVNNEHTCSLYADVEQHTAAFAELFMSSCGAAVDKYPDLLQKQGILCIFQFEALLFRHFYEPLPGIIKQARLCNDANVLKALGGCLLQSDAPVQGSLLKSIVNEIFTLEDFKSDRLAQYLRCIVQALLTLADDGAARQIFDQAIEVAEEAKEV